MPPSDDAFKEHQLRYWRRKAYARRHGLHPASVWDLPDDAELTCAERVVQVEALDKPEISGPALACCGDWYAVTGLPFCCPTCHATYLEEPRHAD